MYNIKNINICFNVLLNCCDVLEIIFFLALNTFSVEQFCSITLFYLVHTNFLYRSQILFLHFTHYFLLWVYFPPFFHAHSFLTPTNRHAPLAVFYFLLFSNGHTGTCTVPDMHSLHVSTHISVHIL